MNNWEKIAKKHQDEIFKYILGVEEDITKKIQWDPVHQEGDKWFFWHPHLMIRLGPYDSEDDARADHEHERQANNEQ